jgi:hypothetical protein
MDQGNMPDGLSVVWLNCRSNIGDESRRYLYFLAMAMLFDLFHC